MKPGKCALAAVVCIAVLMLTFGLPTAAARGIGGPTTAGPMDHSIVVLPNGHDDTADLQAAFNSCTSHGWTCTVQLVKGTYYTAQIVVTGFQGTFAGAGPGRTIVQALPNLPSPNPTYNTATTPFWAGMPTGAAGSNPWPVLFTFVNGKFSVSGITFTEPNEYPVITGWYGNLDVTPPATTSQSLYAVVLVTGETAYSTFRDVGVTGAAGDLTLPLGTPSSFNLEAGIVYEGMFLPSGWTDFFADQIPLSGIFSMMNSNLNYAGVSAFYMENLLSASVTVCYNSVSSSPAPEFLDVSNSQLTFCGNSITNVAYATGLGALQSYFKTNLLPSTVYITDNYFGTNWEGSGPALFDYGPLFYGIPSTLNAVVTGNVVVSDNSCECYTQAVSDVIIDYSLASMVVSQNTIYGGGGGVEVRYSPATVSWNTIVGAYIGVVVNTANGTHVIGNVIKDSVQYGIAVTNGSSYNVIALNLVKGSGVYDLYWDQTGTGNVWKWNVCQTSSPPGLC